MVTFGVVKVVMNNHFYTFGGNIYRQSDGGDIGTEIAGEITRNTIGHWDLRFVKLLKNLGILIDLHKRYVYVIFNMLAPINKRWENCHVSKRMKYDKTVAENNSENLLCKLLEY